MFKIKGIKSQGCCYWDKCKLVNDIENEDELSQDSIKEVNNDESFAELKEENNFLELIPNYKFWKLWNEELEKYNDDENPNKKKEILNDYDSLLEEVDKSNFLLLDRCMKKIILKIINKLLKK